MKSNSGNQGKTRWLRWIARIWSIPLIAFTLLLTAGYTWSYFTTGTADPYAVEEVRLVETLPPIVMGLSTLCLGIAWRWERTGALLALALEAVVILLLLILRPITGFDRYTLTPFIMALVVIVPAVLFLLGSRRSG